MGMTKVWVLSCGRIVAVWVCFVVSGRYACDVFAGDLETAMEMSEQRLVSIVPDECPAVDSACPICRTYHNWKWSVQRPFEIVCPQTGTVFPNSKYAMDKKAVMWNYAGEKKTVRYYEGPAPKGVNPRNPHKGRYYLGGKIDDLRYNWIRRRVLPQMMDAYEKTGDQRYTRRIALILDRLADVLPHYLVHDGRNVHNWYISTGGPCMVDGKLKGAPGRDSPFPHTASRWTNTWISELDMTMLKAYETIKGGAAVKKLSKDKGCDVVGHIEDGLLEEFIRFYLDIPWSDHLANNLMTTGGLARFGKTMGKPEYVHIAYRYMAQVFTHYGRDHFGAGYTFDLHHSEGFQGHEGVTSRIYGVFESIEGYSDPPGYVDKVDGKHLENVSIKDFPLFEKTVHKPEVYTFPSGARNPTNDSIGYFKIGTRGALMHAFPLSESRNRILPGLGHAVLGDGVGDEQSQVQLEFSEQGANHKHTDCLGIVWFAHGRDHSGDIGYQRHKLRTWAATTLSHNTVVVNRRTQNLGDTFGNVLMYVSDLQGLGVISVEAHKAYRRDGVNAKVEGLNVTRYRRTLVNVTTDTRSPYFVDIFEVHGGRMHDYAIHGDVWGDMTGESSLAMKKMSGDRPLLAKGEKWVEPTPDFRFPSSVYGLFGNVGHGRALEDFTVTFRYKSAAMGTRIHLLRDDMMEVFLGETPALRKAGHYNDELVYEWSMPHMIARHRLAQGRDDLESVFVVVYDMYKDRPRIERVRRLDAGADAVGLEIV